MSGADPGLVIVGGGIAAQSLAEATRALDGEIPITILSAEGRAPYDRVQLSTLLATGGDPDALRLRPEPWYVDRRVALRLGTRAAAIDRDAPAVLTASGERVPYRALALCTGSSAAVPPIPGIVQEGVLTFRTPEDCEEILAAARGARRVAVLGGGLLGLEAARGLVDAGASVTVVHLMGALMERQLDEPAGAILAARMAELEVDVLLGRETERILGEGHVTGMRFRDGSELRCDALVVCVGIRPSAELARDCGLATDRGIVVDDRMRTSDPEIVAVGECAEHRGVVHGLVAPIYDQAKVAAATVLGRPDPVYAGSVPSATLKVMGVDLVAAGDVQGVGVGGATVHDASGIYRRLVVRDGRAVGAILMGDTRGAEALVALVARGAELSDPLVTLAESHRASAVDLPDEAQICSCNGVSKGDILEAIRTRGLCAPSEVRACTRAGTGCGGCSNLVAELVQAETGRAEAEPAYLCPCRGLTREAVTAVAREREVRSVSALGAACGAGNDCGACKPALAYLVQLLADNRHDEEPHARFVNDRVHANIQRDGTYSVVPRIRGGVTSPEELRRIADVAERHEVPMVKITGGQRIDLLGVRKEQLPQIWAELDMDSGFAYAKAVRTVKTCVGTDFCRFGIGDAVGLGIDIERDLEGLHTPHKVKMAVSGCPRNCAESLVKDIGVVAVEGGWEILVGGAAGSRVRQGDLLARVDTAAEARRVVATFLQHYREQAEYLERSYVFVERVGIEAIRAVVLDEASGEPERLRQRLALSKEAAVDPWRAAVEASA